MSVTIKEIAIECGVTPSTVSLALSGPNKRVSEKKRKLILETAKRMNYTPNRAAVSLATRHSRMVGIIISDLRNSHISMMFMAINEVLQAQGYCTACHILSGGTDEESHQAVAEMLAVGVDGIIFAPPSLVHKEISNSVNQLNTSGIPVVSNASLGLIAEGCDVLFDFREGGYIATKYLLECGHRVIGCLSGPNEFDLTKERLNGYKQALNEFGVPFKRELVYEGDYSIASGRKALGYLLGQKATAVFSFNDEMAFGLYQSSRQYGIQIPNNLSIVGCDNVPFADVLKVPLSTVNVPAEIMGKKMAEELIKSISGAAPSKKRRTAVYHPNLILRSSVRNI